MENMRGIAMSTKWAEMQLADRYKIIKQVFEMEKELVRFKFSAYGSLYMRDCVPHGYRHCPLPPDLDPAGFCIGPSCSVSVWGDDFIHVPQSVAHAGPCELCHPLIEINIWRLEGSFLPWGVYPSAGIRLIRFRRNWEAGVQKQLNRFDEKQSVDEYSSLLHKVKRMLPILSVIEVADSVLWHQDMHLGQIFVSLDDKTTIQGIIDCQTNSSCSFIHTSSIPEVSERLQGFDTPNYQKITTKWSPRRKKKLYWNTERAPSPNTTRCIASQQTNLLIMQCH